MITLTIPELTPSLNITRAGHWRTRHQRRKHWSMLVLVAKSEARAFSVQKLERARVTIQRHGGRKLDEDNLAGGCKDLIDGLRDNGFIENDDPDHLTVRFEQHPGTRTPRQTIITIEAA